MQLVKHLITFLVLALLLIQVAGPCSADSNNRKKIAAVQGSTETKEEKQSQGPSLGNISTFAGFWGGSWLENSLKDFSKNAKWFAKRPGKRAQQGLKYARQAGRVGVFMGKALIVVPAGLAFVEGSADSKTAEMEGDLKQIDEAAHHLERLRDEQGADSPEYQALRDRLLRRAQQKEGHLEFFTSAIASRHALYGVRTAGAELLSGLITKTCADAILKWLKIDMVLKHDGNDLLASHSRKAWRNWNYQISNAPAMTDPLVRINQARRLAKKGLNKALTTVPDKKLGEALKGASSSSYSTRNAYTKPVVPYVPSSTNSFHLAPTLPDIPDYSAQIRQLEEQNRVRQAVQRAVRAARPVEVPMPVRAVSVQPVARPLRAVARPARPLRAASVRPARPSASTVNRARNTCVPTYTPPQRTQPARQKVSCSNCWGSGRITQKVPRKELRGFKRTVDAGFNPDGSPVRHTVWDTREVTIYEDESISCPTCGGSGRL